MIRYKSNPDLDKLDRILNFDIASALPSIFSIFLDHLSRLSILLAVLATPYILWLLLRLIKFGLLLFFILFVGGPGVALHLFFRNTDWAMHSYFIPIGFLVVYLVLLKNTYNDWREPAFIDKKISRRN